MMTDASAGKKVFLGRVGENEARVVRFSVGKMLAAFPGATFTMLNRRPCDAAAYPVNDQYVSLAGDTVLWTIQSGDVTVAGTGECEIRAEKDGKILKSQIFMTATGTALDGSGTPPQPWESWVQQVEDAAEDAEAAAQLLENVSATAETLEPGEQATASYADGVFTFGIPRGADGQGQEIHDTVTDQNVANVPDACAGNVDELVLQLNPIQAGSGNPAPDNVRAISGRSSVVLKVSGADTSEYTSHTATIPTPPGTVYGGEIDWVNGKLKVTMALVSKKYSELNNGSGTTPEGYSIKSIDITSVLADYSIATSAVCNVAKYNASSNAQNVFRITSTGKYIYLTLPTSMDADAIVNVCYPLATTIEYDLSSLDEITLVFGENNIWIDNGKIKSMTYPCDTKLYIDKKVSTLQALILEH